jgi:quercetin dioxygenase-like cupin family protein
MSKYFVKRAEASHYNIFPGVDILTMAGEQVMLSYVELEPHSEVAQHSHPHEQLGILISGQLTFTIGEEQQVLGPGDMWRIPGGVEHHVVAGDEPARAIDIFHPVREDYL